MPQTHGAPLPFHLALTQDGVGALRCLHEAARRLREGAARQLEGLHWLHLSRRGTGAGVQDDEEGGGTRERSLTLVAGNTRPPRACARVLHAGVDHAAAINPTTGIDGRLCRPFPRPITRKTQEKLTSRFSSSSSLSHSAPESPSAERMEGGTTCYVTLVSDDRKVLGSAIAHTWLPR